MTQFYRVGTASISNNATAVIGTLTGWTNQVKPGDAITFDGGDSWHEIAAVGQDNVSLTLSQPYPKPSVTGGAYAIIRLSRQWGLASDLSASVADLLDEIEDRPDISVGSSAPTGGADGDVHFQKTGNDLLYRRKASGVWPAGFSLRGATPSAPNPNLLANGRFLINQRAFAGGALSTGSFGHDRWFSDSFLNYSVSNGQIIFQAGRMGQMIEPVLFGFRNLAGRQLTVSLWDPSVGFTVGINDQMSGITAGTGQRSVTLTVPQADTGRLKFTCVKQVSGPGSVTGMKVEVGDEATPWCPRDDWPLALYYYVTGMKVGGSGSASAAGQTQRAQTGVTFPIPMRAVPVVTGTFVAGSNSNPSGSLFIARLNRIGSVMGWPSSGSGSQYWDAAITLDAEITS